MIYKDATWTKIKDLNAQGFAISYSETPEMYRIYVFADEYQWECDLFRDFWPAACHMTREQNDGYVADFETNYKPGATQL